MASPAEIPERDEALKALVARFKQDPDGTFAPLAAALLSRGHAAEALRVSEHGLDRHPGHVEGRLERAKALLASGRPRVAFVELQRCLALAPDDRRTLRLLGQVFKEAGAPERAAQLLARRSKHDEIKEVESAPPERLEAREPVEASHDAKPLFFDLAADLGLAVPARTESPKRIEVTQVIRRKAIPRPPRSHSELRAIEGPIVDATQPGQLEEAVPTEMDLLADVSPVFSADTLQPLEDEPLVLEGHDFQLQPVETGDLFLNDEDEAVVSPPPPPGAAMRSDMPRSDPFLDPEAPLDEPWTAPTLGSGDRPDFRTPTVRDAIAPNPRSATGETDPDIQARAVPQDFDQLLTGDIPNRIEERRSWKVAPFSYRVAERTPRQRLGQAMVVAALAGYAVLLVWFGWPKLSAWLGPAAQTSESRAAAPPVESP